MRNLSERKIDKLLNVKTRGTRESKNKQHYRYEATPYDDLFLLFDLIELNENDTLVDFGSGRGRICFITNYLFKTKTIGIEANPLTFDESLINLDSYVNYKNDNVMFFLDYAENYDIKKEENVFFFFNPFTIQIFKKVISNIQSSLKAHPRDIKIILAYPIIEYVSYLLEHTNFNVENFVEHNGDKIHMNKFLILNNK